MSSRTGASPPRSLCVVDNDPSVCSFMKMFLEKHGYEVITAEDGLQALTTLRDVTPEVVFIDLVMPNISGEKLCQILRSQKRFDDTYLIVLSAISSEEEIDYASFGFDACIAKGPLKKVGELVLSILGKLGSEIVRGIPGGVYGLENLYKREITRELLSTKRHFELILANMTESIVEIARDGRIVFANPAATALFGVPEEVLLSLEFVGLFDRAERAGVESHLKEAVDLDQRHPLILTHRKRILSLQVLPVVDDGRTSLVVIIEDVTAKHRAQEELETRVRDRTAELAAANESLTVEIDRREQLERQLRSSLREKEVMLDEIHHRVKNNLQIISSMLGLNANRVESDEFRGIVRDMRDRVQALSLVHDRLYRSSDLAAVDIGEYFRTLVNGLLSSYQTSDRHVEASVEARDVYLTIDLAVPCALIINELVTNSLKYAFADRSAGEIRVSIRRDEDGSHTLTVRDNGIGLPPEIDLKNVETIGLRLVRVLAGQIGAAMQVGRSHGTVYRFSFAERERTARPEATGEPVEEGDDE